MTASAPAPVSAHPLGDLAAPLSALIPTLDTPRLILRPPREADLDAVAAFYAGDRSRMVGGPLDRLDAWRAMAAILGHWHLRGWGRWIVEDRATGAPAGIVGLHAPEGWPEPEIGWTVFDGFEGRGVAFEAATAARRYAYGPARWPTAISLVDPANDRSAALARRMGCTRDGGFMHAAYGQMDIWRHPSPAEAEDRDDA